MREPSGLRQQVLLLGQARGATRGGLVFGDRARAVAGHLEQMRADEVDLYSEQYEVRDSAKRNLYTGKTYNSVDNIAQFFAERGMPAVALGPGSILQAHTKDEWIAVADLEKGVEFFTKFLSQL